MTRITDQLLSIFPNFIGTQSEDKTQAMKFNLLNVHGRKTGGRHNCTAISMITLQGESAEKKLNLIKIL